MASEWCSFARPCKTNERVQQQKTHTKNMKNRGSIEHNTTCFSKYAPKIADSHTRVQSQAGLFPPCMSYYTKLHFLELFLQKPRDPLENPAQVPSERKLQLGDPLNIVYRQMCGTEVVRQTTYAISNEQIT